MGTLFLEVLIQNSKNCYLKSENKLLVSIGLEEIIIVETQDATLVANKKIFSTSKRDSSEIKSGEFF